MENAPSNKRPVPTYLLVIAAMILGVIVGPLLGKDAVGFGALGALTIALIKAVATPLLFLAIVRAVVTTEVSGRSLGRMTVIALINVSIAIAIGLTVSNVFKPGAHLSATATPAAADYASKQLDFLKTVESFVPTDIVTPFQKNAVLSVVLLALMLGFALRVVRREAKRLSAIAPTDEDCMQGASPQDEAITLAQGARVIEQAIEALFKVTEVILSWVLKLIPLAVFGVVAKTVGEHGLAPLRGLAIYVFVGILGLSLHALLTYQAWLLFYARIPLRTFWSAAREPMVVAFGSNSSLATLPVTLRALDKLGVSRSSSAVGACVGTNLNNDGIVLYEGMAALLVAQAHGVDLSLAGQLMIALVCIVAAMGVAGVPEAGFISLAIVLNAAHLPLDILPMLLTVDWVIARGRSVTNVLSDMVLSIVLDARQSRAAPS
jgi:DAACS family dicarboxylate/amino acid:cation (Na+ or H+) symporter